MLKDIIRTLFILAILIIIPVTPSYSLSTNEPINIINKFQYKFENSSINTKGIPNSVLNNNDDWINFTSIKELSKKVKNESKVWFRVKLPEMKYENQGIYFEQLYANSLDIYIGTKKIYDKHRKVFQNYNSLVLPLNKADSNQYLYLKVYFYDSKIGPKEIVLIGDYEKLQYKYLIKDSLSIYMGFGLIFMSLAVLVCSFILKNNSKKMGISLTFIILSLGIILVIARTNFLMFYSQYETFLLVLFDLALFSFFPNLTYFFELVIISGRSRFIRRFLKAQAGYSGFCIIFMFINIIMDYRLNNICAFFFMSLIGVFFIIQLISLVGFGIYYTKKGNKSAKIFILGFSSFAILLFSELLIYIFIYRDYNFIMWKWGLVCFTISLIIIFGMKYVENYEKLHHYSRELEKMNDMARTDFLTNLPNRMDMYDRIQSAIRNYRLKNEKFFLVLCDIDNFKRVNDTYGHSFGDEVLIEFSRITKNTLDNLGAVGRWGGEEFLLLISSTSYKEAHDLVEKIRISINSHKFEYKDETIQISVTFGLCEYDDSKGIEKCLDCIDDALYHGKRNGKNRVISYENLIHLNIKDGI